MIAVKMILALIRKVAVNGDQDFVGTGCNFQEIAIFQSFESCVFDGVHLVAGEIALEMARYALVKQQLHFRAAFPLRVLKIPLTCSRETVGNWSRN